MRYLWVHQLSLIYATQPCDPLEVTKARCSLSRTASQRIYIQLCTYFAATATYHCKMKPLSHYVGAQSFLETKSDSVKLWFTSYASVRNSRLLSIHTIEISCFSAITAVSLINIIVITWVSVIFTPSSFPKQISLGKKRKIVSISSHMPIFSFTSHCSSALTNTMATSVRLQTPWQRVCARISHQCPSPGALSCRNVHGRRCYWIVFPPWYKLTWKY